MTRSIGVSEVVFRAVTRLASASGKSKGVIVHDLLRDAGLFLPEDNPPPVEVKRSLPPHVDRERRIEETPCRQERCQILHVHPSHDEDFQ